MKKITIDTRTKKMLADIYTPVGIYLRIRDRYPGSVLLESTDYHSRERSYSYICINPLAGIEISDPGQFEFKLPGESRVEKRPVTSALEVVGYLNEFMDRFEITSTSALPFAEGLYGYTSFDAVQFFDTITLRERGSAPVIPLMRYRLYQYVIAIHHFKDELYLSENVIPGISGDAGAVETLIRRTDCPGFPFSLKGTERGNMEDQEYMQLVEKGRQHCLRGDVFQIVLSRSYSRPFTGDEFNVYRALRSVNPSPYLFYFDYGDYRLMGSSPESHLLINKGKATIHPIAGTFTRTGDDDQDRVLAEQLIRDPKENAEHVMLVDLARNDLSRHASVVQVDHFKEVQFYSHVIHLVSEVTGKINPGSTPFTILADTFPAGTLSGAPKYRAIQLIDQLEPTSRGFYGGCIGFIGFNGDFVHAIMIRSLLSRMNTLYYQAGAGIVARSVPATELQEVNNKLNALKKAMEMAQNG
ncbi:MAG TPA: chorismate-binding protein [Chitinophagaceae bacterium]|nr:chorismate-binding protein [Chitinophagaceae bacterium]